MANRSATVMTEKRMTNNDLLHLLNIAFVEYQNQ